MASKHGGFLSRAAHSHPGSTRIASTAGTHAEQGHVQTADDAVQEAERVINQKHHSGSQGFKTEADDSKSKLSACLSSATFESALAILICLNVFLIIAETDVTAKGQDPPLWMDVANISFLIMYSIECVLKISAFRFAYFQDAWNWLDLSVVFTDIVLTLLNLLTGVEGASLSVIRVFRLIKLTRTIRVVRQIWELKILLLGFKAAARSILFGMGMVIVMTIVWAILGVQLIHPVNAKIWEDSECEICQEAFGSVWSACITIFQTVVAGDSWGYLAIPIIRSEWWTSLWFFVVLVTVQLAMLNLILAVIVERAADAREQEMQRAILDKEGDMHKSKLRLIQLCRELDTDGSGRISEEEFLDGFENNPEFAAALLGIGVYPEDISLLFEVLDTDGTGQVTYVSFVNTLARLRTQMSQVILFSVIDLRKSISAMQNDLKELKGKTMNHPKIGVPASKATKASDNTALMNLVQSTEVGLEKDVAQHLEETSREMQHRFQEMQQEISRSFHNALTAFVEVVEVGAHVGARSELHLDAVLDDVGIAFTEPQGLDEGPQGSARPYEVGCNGAEGSSAPAATLVTSKLLPSQEPAPGELRIPCTHPPKSTL